VEASVESLADEVALGRGSAGDSVRIAVLPAVRATGEPDAILGSLLDALLETLRLDLVYARSNDLELMRVGGPLEGISQETDVRRALDLSRGDAGGARVLLRELELSVAVAPLGLQGEIGIVVAGSRRLDFPSESEQLLLDIAAMKATIGLQRARLREAERNSHVGKRTAEGDPLEGRERDLKLFIDTIPALAWSARPDGSAQFFNQPYLDFVGLSAEQASGWGWTAAVHPDDLPPLVATWQRVLASEAPGEAEARLRRHDGEYRWFLFCANPLRDENGDIVNWCGINTDIDRRIARRKNAESEIRRAYDHLTEVQRLSHTGSFTSDLEKDEHAWSDEFYRICEFEPGSVITIERLAEIVHPEDVHMYQSAMQRAIAGTNPEFSFRIVTSSGVVKHLHGFAHRVSDRPLFVGAIQDVTESRLAEEALNRARSELEHMARVTTLSVLTASIAHEVNQPLAGIITNASTSLRMLDRDPPNVAGARQTARLLLRDGNRAAEVIGRLRALFSKREYTLESVDLNEAIREVISLSSTELRRNRVTLRPVLANDLPRVDGDRVQLQHVILNLLRNASDAMVGIDDRPRTLLIKTESETANHVRVMVRDTGNGLDPQSLGKLFDAFYTTKIGGMGIGLSVSRSIVERHNGRLWAEPNDGPGATFVFSIPLGRADTERCS
jgi:PAS domain S-box-containing protein